MCVCLCVYVYIQRERKRKSVFGLWLSLYSFGGVESEEEAGLCLAPGAIALEACDFGLGVRYRAVALGGSWVVKSPNKGYKYSYPIYNPTYNYP